MIPLTSRIDLAPPTASCHTERVGWARRFWWLVAAWAVTIFALSSIPGDAMPHVEALRYDKVVHACVYAVLGALVFFALSFNTSMTKKRIVALAAVLALAYGLSDEFHQLFVRGRSAELYDAMADGIGGLIGATIAALVPFARSRAA